jgi:hypothetical protein
MILPPCFLTQEEMKDAPSEDLWCEIADAMFYSSPEVDAYVILLNDELKNRNKCDKI